MKEHLFDKRVVQRALQEGLLKQDEYQRMLDALPDLSDKLQTASDISARGDQGGLDDLDDHDEDDLDDDEDDDEADDDEQQAHTAPEAHTAHEAHHADDADDTDDDAEDGDAPTPNAFSTEL